MFNVHFSFIESMIEKGYLGTNAYLFKEGAMFDRDVWQLLRTHNVTGEFVRAFFLMGLGGNEEEKIIKWLTEDKGFGTWMLGELSGYLYPRYNSNQNKKNELGGQMPAPFGGIQSPLSRIFEAVLGTLPIDEILKDPGNMINTVRDSNSYLYGMSDDLRRKKKRLTVDYVRLQEWENLFKAHILLNKKRMFFLDNCSNFTQFDFAARNSGISHRDIKHAAAFNVTKLEIVPDVIKQIYNAHTFWMPEGALALAEWEGCLKENRKTKGMEINALGVPIPTSLYFTNEKLGISENPTTTQTINIRPYLVTDKMTRKRLMPPEYYTKGKDQPQQGKIVFNVNGGTYGNGELEKDSMLNKLVAEWGKIEIPVTIKSYKTETFFGDTVFPKVAWNKESENDD